MQDVKKALAGRTDIRKLRFVDGKVVFLCGHHLSELIDRWNHEHPKLYPYPYMNPGADGTWEVVGYWDRDWDGEAMEHCRPVDFETYVCERCAEIMARMGRDLSGDKIPGEQAGLFERK